jgi:hypothetical protein
MFGGIFKRLRHFDAYPKPLEDFRVKTLSGAIITVICTLSILVLFIYEWKSYTSIEVDQELFVDLTRNQKLTINLNITFPFLPCELLSVSYALFVIFKQNEYYFTNSINSLILWMLVESPILSIKV